MNLSEIMNSPGLWVASSFMVIILIAMCVIYLRLGIKRANEVGISKERYISAIRSAAITSIGPAFSPVIVLLSLIVVIGAPTAWMRLNDVGAARTELAIITLASNLLGVEPSSADFGIQAFSYSQWAMALNNLGWFAVACLLTHRMSKAVTYLNQKYDPKWIKLLMLGATFGVTGYLLANQITSPLLKVNNAMLTRMSGLITALISAGCMLLMSKLFEKHQRLQELALGIAMLAGMFGTQLILG